MSSSRCEVKMKSTLIALLYGSTSALSSTARLFASGEEGAWYDPSDISTLFQDSAGTTPVTTAGQPVGLMLDKSGRGNHATQATSAARPTYQTGAGLSWLAFDGVDDSMVTGTITPNVDKAQMFAGVQKQSNGDGIIMETNTTNANGSMFLISANLYGSSSRGNADPDGNQRADTANANGVDTAVVTTTHDIAGNLTRIARNRVYGANATGDKGTGNFLAYPLYIGARAGTSLEFPGNMYGLILRFGPNLTATQIADTETYMAAHAGVTL
jgi:hypothetical protein